MDNIFPLFSFFFFFFYYGTHGHEHLHNNFMAVLSNEILFPGLTIDTNIQASSGEILWPSTQVHNHNFSDINSLSHLAPSTGLITNAYWHPNHTNFCSIGFMKKTLLHHELFWSVMEQHPLNYELLLIRLLNPQLSCAGMLRNCCFWKCWQWQSVDNNSISGPSQESWVLGTGISEL